MAHPSADRRTPAFCYQTLDALKLLREHYDGPRRATALAVYTTMTEVANAKGGAEARPSFQATRKEIAELVGVAVDTFDRYVREFEQIGLVEVDRQKIGTTNLPNTWHLIDAPTSRTGAAPLAAPTPPLARDPGLGKELVVQEENQGPPSVSPLPTDRPSKVDGKPTKDAEYELAHAILIEFNRVAGTGYHGKEWITKIVMRLREEPSGTLDDHIVVIEHAFTDPWWHGPPSPAVIYGNQRLFQQMVTAASVEPTKQRGLTADEVRAMAHDDPVDG